MKIVDLILNGKDGEVYELSNTGTPVWEGIKVRITTCPPDNARAIKVISGEFEETLLPICGATSRAKYTFKRKEEVK